MMMNDVHFGTAGLPVCGASALFGSSPVWLSVTCPRCLELLGAGRTWPAMHFRRAEGTGLASSTACGLELVYPSTGATVFPWSVTCRACLEEMTEAEVADGGRFVPVADRVDAVKVAAWVPTTPDLEREARGESAGGVVAAFRDLREAFVDLVEAVTCAVCGFGSSVWRPMSRYERRRSLVVFGLGVVLAGGVAVLLEVRS